MKALLFNQKGSAEQVLALEEIAIADLQPGEVRVKLLASPINPADLMFIEKTYRQVPVYPQVAGFEGAGVIVENGGDDRYPKNSLVAFRHKNVWAEYINSPKEKLILLPQNMPVEKAAQLALNPITAWALLEESDAKPGEWIMLSAANSALSKLIIQFANARDLKTIAIVRANDHQQSLRDLGAKAVVLADDADLEMQIRTLTGDEKIAGFLDAVGGELVSKMIKVISANSRIIHYGLFSDNPVMYHNADVIFKNLVIKGFGIDAWLQTKSGAELEKIWHGIISAVIAPDYKMEVAAKYPLEQYQKAFAESKSTNNGKVLFCINE